MSRYDDTPMIEERDGTVRVRLRVQARAARTEIVGEHEGALRIRVAAPPVDGAANEALVKFLAKRLGVTQSAVRIASGDTGRTKLVVISGVDANTATRLLLG